MAINFATNEVKINLRNKTKLKSFLKERFAGEGRRLKNLQYIFCSDEYLLQINQEFLQHDTLTDIVTFELSDDPEVTEGEIYISIDRVKDNAQKFEVSEEQELHRVIFHGALHLCGYKDKTKKEAATMRKKENEYLRLYFEE